MHSSLQYFATPPFSQVVVIGVDEVEWRDDEIAWVGRQWLMRGNKPARCVLEIAVFGEDIMRILFFLLCNELFFSFSTNAKIIETEFFSIHHALDERELEQFEIRIVNELDAFVRYWFAVGFGTTDKKVTIYVQPSLSVKNADALVELFGEDLFVDVDKLLLATETSSPDWQQLYQAFMYKYPVFIRRKYLEEPTRDHASGICARLKQLRDDPKEQLHLLDNNAYYMHLKALNPQANNVIVLGGSTDLSVKEHPYLTLDTAFHEIGHWFFSNVLDRISGPGANPLPTFNELVADMVATTYLNNSCRIKKGDGSCGRDVSKHEKHLANHLWHEEDPHNRNAPVAHFCWEFFKAHGLDIFANTLVSALENSLVSSFRIGDEYSKTQLTKDYFLRKSSNYYNDFSFALSLANGFNVSETIANFFGDGAVGLEIASTMYSNSPVRIGSQEKALNLDGREVILRFSNTGAEPKNIMAHVQNNEQTRDYESGGLLFSDSTNFQFMFNPVNESEQTILWRYDGVLTYDDGRD